MGHPGLAFLVRWVSGKGGRSPENFVDGTYNWGRGGGVELMHALSFAGSSGLKSFSQALLKMPWLRKSQIKASG